MSKIPPFWRWWFGTLSAFSGNILVGLWRRVQRAAQGVIHALGRFLLSVLVGVCLRHPMILGGTDIQGKKVPVRGGGGRCIYCGSDGGAEGLRDEHTVPFSLSGNAQLLAASCRKCEAITSYLDGYLAHAVFGHFRPHAGVQSRSGHPETLPAIVELANGQKVVDLMTKDHPFFLNMPVWRIPGILRGAPPTEDFAPAFAHVYWSVPPNIRETLGIKHGEVARIADATKIPNLKTFGRAIAKIAYCNAIMEVGLDNFRPLAMPDLILGRYPNIPYFVGSDPGEPPPPLERGVMHSFEFVEIEYNRLKLLAVKMRLFAHAGTKQNGMPIYTVVVGQRYTSKAVTRRLSPVLPRSILL